MTTEPFPAAVAAADVAPAPVARTNFLLLLLLSLTIALGWTLLGLFSPVQEAAKADMGLTDDQMGLLQGAAVAVPLALLSIPFGRMTDRGHRVRLLAGLGVAWTVGVIGSAFAPEFWSLFACRVLIGAGAVLCVPVAISIGADLSSVATRGRSMFILGVGKTIGQAAAFAVGAAAFTWAQSAGLFGLAPWRATHLVVGVVGAVLLLPLILMKEPARAETASGGDHSLRAAMGEIWKRRAFLLPLYAAYVAVIMADVAAAVWAAPILQRSFNQQPADFGGWMGAVVLGAGVFGALAGGVAADMGREVRWRGGLMLAALVAAVAGVPAATFAIMPDVAMFGALLGLLLFAGAVMGLVTATALALVIPNEIRGICLAVLLLVGGVVGFGFGPSVVTLVSRALGGEAHLPMAVTLVGVIASALSVIAFAVATFNTPARGTPATR